MEDSANALDAGMISGGVGRAGRYRKLRRDIAAKHRRPDVIEAAFEISPDFAADIGPALAEGEILAEIGPALRIDHALEQREPVRAARQRIGGMLAEELQRCVSGMLAHPLQHVRRIIRKPVPA